VVRAIHSNSGAEGTAVRSPEPCEIEALFGSSARGDSDELSDVDYLLVDDSTIRLLARKKWLEGQGISVSDYTWRRLVRLFTNRTLFAIHLKHESKSLHDRKGRYADLLASAAPASDYREPFYNSLKLFNLLQEVPASPVGRAWAADHLTVAFRNSAILYLAGDGEYLFSFDGLLENLRARGRIKADGVSALRRLRSVKRAYRSGVVGPVTRSTLQAALGAADRAFGLGIGSREVNGVCIIDSQQGRHSSTDAYSYLRGIERELISVPRPLRQETATAKAQLLQMIQNPHGYLWKAMYARDQIDNLLCTVRNSY
jgi:hypothetical protein